MTQRNKRRILVLFPDEWDRAIARDPRYRDSHEFLFEGFDLFSFPDNARLFTFDALAFVDRVSRRYAGRGLDGVATSDEQFGPFLAALVGIRYLVRHRGLHLRREGSRWRIVLPTRETPADARRPDVREPGPDTVTK